MAKLLNAIIMIVVIEIGLLLFQGGDISATALLGLKVTVLGMDVSFITLIGGAIAGLIGLGIFVGTFSTTVTFAVYAGPAAAFLLLVAVIIQLGSFINAELATDYAMIAALIQYIIIVPLVIYYAIAVIEWVRSNQ